MFNRVYSISKWKKNYELENAKENKNIIFRHEARKEEKGRGKRNEFIK